jgi:putative methyltransferase (TIGR04325 family)
MSRFSGAVKFALSRTPIGSVLGRVSLLPNQYHRWAMAKRDHAGICAGVYPSFRAALAAIPAARQSGWDNEGSSSIWLDNLAPVRPGTYPLFFWLSQLLAPGCVLLDWGGSVGLTYYGYRARADLPTDLRWIIAEVEAIADQGRRVADRERATHLSFVTDFASVPACDVLLSAGAIQYMESSIPGLFERLGHRPRFVLLNKVPLSSNEDYWSLQNFGPAISPYRVFNETAFLKYFEDAGYGVRDRWLVAELDLDIPFHPQHCVEAQSGLLFERRE